MFTIKTVTLSTFQEPSGILEELYAIFTATLNKGLSYEEFHTYYFRQPPHYMDVSFLKVGPKDIGFICAAFYKQKLGNKHTRSAVGLLASKKNTGAAVFPAGNYAANTLITNSRIRWRIW